MSTFTFYMHTVSGDIATLSDWRADYESMDVESWHGLPADECDAKKWLEDGKLTEIKLFSEDECFLSNGVFPFCFNDANEDGEYLSEWQDYAEDSEGERYLITWRFPAVLGEEPEDDAWPWDDESHIYSVEAV